MKTHRLSAWALVALALVTFLLPPGSSPLKGGELVLGKPLAVTDQPPLINQSVRVIIPANGVVILGFVVAKTCQVLIRAVGPGLAPLGVTGVNPDPILEVFRSGETKSFVLVDDWGMQPSNNGVPIATSAQISAAAAQVGAFPLQTGSFDAATVLTLQPGGYTAQARGGRGASGDTLVEVYLIQ